jgi:predicted thioesterase
MGKRPAIGEEVTHQVTVTADMTARLFDREIHPVYATAWMVRHVEEAGRLLVERHLEPDEDATGYRIELEHVRPVRVGTHISVRAWVTDVTDRQCRMGFEVRGPAGVVGRGSFVQRYVRLGALQESTERSEEWPTSS